MSTGDVVDATRALALLDLLDRELVRIALRSVLIKHEPDLAVFDRAFDLVFAPGAALPEQPDAGAAVDAATAPADGRRPRRPTSAPRPRPATSTRCARSRPGPWRCSATTTASDGASSYRIMRALDVANMLSAAMRRLRDEGELSEFELSLRRHEIARALEAFRRALADEIAKRRLAAPGDDDDQALPIGAARPARAARCRAPSWPSCGARCSRWPASSRRASGAVAGHGRRAASILRRTFRRSLQSGGIPIDPALRRPAPAPARRRRAVRHLGLGRRVRPVHVHARARDPRRARRGAQLRLRRRRRRHDRDLRRPPTSTCPVQRCSSAAASSGSTGTATTAPCSASSADRVPRRRRRPAHDGARHGRRPQQLP